MPLGDSMRDYYSYHDTDFSLQHQYSHVPDQSKFVLHTHPKAEIYYFVGGAGVFHIEGSAYPLESGDLLLMQSAESHYIELDKSQPYERKVLHFNLNALSAVDPKGVLWAPFLAREPGKQNLYKPHQFRGGSCEHYFDTMMTAAYDPRVSIFAGLIPLMHELCALQAAAANETNPEEDTTAYRIMRYLNQNLDKQISLDSICKKFYISKSQLCRVFRDSTGVTVKQYLTAKRLVRAKQMIDSGLPPTHTYLDCGFNDYSSFYRAYIKYYGAAPTCKKDKL